MTEPRIVNAPKVAGSGTAVAVAVNEPVTDATEKCFPELLKIENAVALSGTGNNASVPLVVPTGVLSPPVEKLPSLLRIPLSSLVKLLKPISENPLKATFTPTGFEGWIENLSDSNPEPPFNVFPSTPIPPAASELNPILPDPVTTNVAVKKTPPSLKSGELRLNVLPRNPPVPGVPRLVKLKVWITAASHLAEQKANSCANATHRIKLQIMVFIP